MAKLTIQDLPEDAHRALKEHADLTGLTIEAVACDALTSRFSPDNDLGLGTKRL